MCREMIRQRDEEPDLLFVWSDDLLQSSHFCGGYDPEDVAFWFGYYADDGKQYVFRLTIEDAERIAANGDVSCIVFSYIYGEE